MEYRNGVRNAGDEAGNKINEEEHHEARFCEVEEWKQELHAPAPHRRDLRLLMGMTAEEDGRGFHHLPSTRGYLHDFPVFVREIVVDRHIVQCGAIFEWEAWTFKAGFPFQHGKRRYDGIRIRGFVIRLP